MSAAAPCPLRSPTADDFAAGNAAVGTASGNRRRTLQRSQRIKRGGDFLRTRSAGRRIVSGCLVFNWMEKGTDGGTRVGIITTRKLGGAVVRSRARRLLREAFRLNQHVINRPIDLVLVARSSIVAKSLGGVEGDFLVAAKRAGLLEPEMQKPKA